MASPYPRAMANIYPNLNSDTVDGFRRKVMKKFKKLSCFDSGLAKERKEKCSDGNSLDFTGNKKKQKLSPPEFDWDNNEYDFSHPNRGLALIINNQDFSKCSFLDDRAGSNKDASALYNSFTLLGFHVKPFNDLEAWEMVEILKIASKVYDHGASDCFVCAVLTHGTETEDKLQEDPSAEMMHLDVLFGVDGIAVTVNYLTETFNDTYCPALKDKPRLFFLQACRGIKCDDGQTILIKKRDPKNLSHRDGGDFQNMKREDLTVTLQEENDSSFSRDDERLQNLPLDKMDVVLDADAGDDDDDDDESNEPGDSECNSQQQVALDNRTNAFWRPFTDPLPCPSPSYIDFLIMYAAPPGHTAWRNEEDGSWFIQTLCKVLNDEYVTSVSLFRTLIRVSGLIARDFESQNDNFLEKKVLPVIESKLRKDIFIRKKTKERTDNVCK